MICLRLSWQTAKQQKRKREENEHKHEHEHEYHMNFTNVIISKYKSISLIFVCTVLYMSMLL